MEGFDPGPDAGRKNFQRDDNNRGTQSDDGEFACFEIKNDIEYDSESNDNENKMEYDSHDGEEKNEEVKHSAKNATRR